MYHIFARQVVCSCHLALARLAATKSDAFFQKFTTSSTMNGSIHSTTTQQRSVGGIDDSIHLQSGNVVYDYLYIFPL